MKEVGILEKKKGFVCIVMCAVMLILCATYTPVKAATTSGSKKINSTYGYLRGEMNSGYSSVDGKYVYTYATTNVAVPFIRAYQKVLIKSTGKQVDQDEPAWIPKAKYAHAECQLIHANPKGYKNTKLVAYGTCDAIVNDSYAVYMSLEW